MTGLLLLCPAVLGDEACARPVGHDGPHDAAFNADEWPTTDCHMCANPTPGQPAHNPSPKCQHRPHIRPHCTCAVCHGR